MSVPTVYYVSATYDLTQDPMAFLNQGDWMHSVGAGSPPGGPGTESAPWCLRTMYWNQADDISAFASNFPPGYDLLETKNGIWQRNWQRQLFSVTGVPTFTFGSWKQVSNHAGPMVRTVNGLTGSVSVGIQVTSTFPLLPLTVNGAGGVVVVATSAVASP